MPNEKAKQNPWLFFADNDLALAEVAIDNIQVLLKQKLNNSNYRKAHIYSNRENPDNSAHDHI